MPTDPFVPPNLDDEPRQEPNLAPGVHMPPAKSWRADRPGDLEAGQPTGRAARLARAERRLRAARSRERVARPLRRSARTSRPTTRGGRRRAGDEAGRALRPRAGDDRHRRRRFAARLHGRGRPGVRARGAPTPCTARTTTTRSDARSSTRFPTRCSACRRRSRRSLIEFRRAAPSDPSTTTPDRRLRCSPHEQLELASHLPALRRATRSRPTPPRPTSARSTRGRASRPTATSGSCRSPYPEEFGGDGADRLDVRDAGRRGGARRAGRRRCSCSSRGSR